MNALLKTIVMAIQALLCVACFGQSVDLSPTRELDRYEEQVNAVLRTRLDEEKAFVAQVIAMVKKGELPQKLVDNAVAWVRVNRSISQRGFVYFERVLRLQAEKLNIELPEFDYQVYSDPARQRLFEGTRARDYLR